MRATAKRAASVAFDARVLGRERDVGLVRRRDLAVRVVERFGGGDDFVLVHVGRIGADAPATQYCAKRVAVRSPPLLVAVMTTRSRPLPPLDRRAARAGGVDDELLLRRQPIEQLRRARRR